MPIASTEDALYQVAYQMGNVASAISNIETDTGFILHDEVVLRVIQGLCSREDFTGITPSYIVGYAFDVAQAVVKAQKERGQSNVR